MDENKSSTGKCVFYGLVFFVSLVLFFVVGQFGTGAMGTVAMSEASLPVVMMQTEQGQTYNRLYGYTAKIDETRLNMELTIVPSSLELPVVIDTYNELIKEVSYKIRAKSDYSLIENTVVEDYELKDNQIQAVFDIKNLIRDNEEYYMEVVLKTDKHEAISYYTTIVKDTGFKLSDKLEYVLKFNACTLDQNRLSEIAGNLETSKNADNSNYGKVDITNTKAMVGWGDLKPTVESNIVPSVHMLDSEVAVVTLDYTVGVGSSESGYDVLKVHEFYRIRHTSARFYLLNFDRQTTQIFDSKSDLISTGKINLGIAPDESVEAMADVKNNYVYFVNNGSLWCFDKLEYKYSKVFAFESEDSDNVRERYDAHEIKMISVAEDGSAYFLVYGYMNRGVHEGQVGISLYRYSYPDNEVKEELYIPSNVPAGILCSNVGEIAHVTASNSLYIKIDDVLYQIDLESKESMTEIKGLTAGSYHISENEKIIAYAVDGAVSGSKSIRVFNIADGTDCYVNASDGDRVRGLGFIINDFIYGVAKEQDTLTDKNGNVNYAMNKLTIIDAAYNEIRSYETGEYYVVDATIEDYRVNLERVTKNEQGQFVSASIDQLINRAENVEVDELEVSTIATDARKKQVVLVLAGGYDGDSSSTTRTALKIEYEENSQFVLPEDIEGLDKYYIRGFGRYISAYNSIEEAVNQAQLQYGRVYDGDNHLVWKRFKAAKASISGLKSTGCEKAQSYDVSKEIVRSYAAGSDVNWLTLESVPIEYVLPFVDLGAPVIGDTLSGYMIITGYTAKEVTYLNTVTGQSVTVSYSDAGKLFSQAGNCWETYYKK